MKLNKHESFKSFPIPHPKNMPKSKSWECPGKGYNLCRQNSHT